MIKRLWYIRNTKKLIFTLSIVLGFFILAYTVFNLPFLDNRISIPMLNNFSCSKLLLITLPIISILIGFIFYFSYIKATEKYKNDFLKLAFLEKLYTGNALIISIFLTIYQNNILSSIKGTGRFSIIFDIIIILCFILYTPIIFINYKHQKKHNNIQEN